MLYCKYKKFIKIFKYIKRLRSTGSLEFNLENKFGDDAKEAVSILKAKGGLYNYNMMSFDLAKDDAKIDAAILEYKEKASELFWGFIKWVIGTGIAIAGLYIAYLSFVK